MMQSVNQSSTQWLNSQSSRWNGSDLLLSVCESGIYLLGQKECSVNPNGYIQPSRWKLDGQGDGRKLAADWRRINGRLTAKWSGIMLVFEWLLWTSGDFQLLHSGAAQWTMIHSTNEHAILNNFPYNDAATHAEIFRAQFTSSIRLWKDSQWHNNLRNNSFWGGGFWGSELS